MAFYILDVELVERLSKLFGGFVDRYMVRYALLFGSWAYGYVRGYSDVDVAVKFVGGLPYEEYLMYAGGLSDELSMELGRDVDVVPINIADTILRYEVFSRHIPIYVVDEDEYVDDMVNSIDEYLDFKGFFDRMYRDIVDRIIHGD